MKKCFLVVGARPNFMKAAALYGPLSRYFKVELVHTGQHYDENMSKIFFKAFDYMKVSHQFDLQATDNVDRFAEIMVKFNSLCDNEKPDIVMVVGDVDSTLACALVANKKNLKVVHVEAGLRSHDMTMPEEVNRRLVDHMADYLYATEPRANDNLFDERVQGKINFSGDVMIDILSNTLTEFKDVEEENYCICTIHRQKNVQDKDILKTLLSAINTISTKHKIIFPIHPNTLRLINEYGYSDLLKNVELKDPMSYIDFLSYVKNSDFVITDSGSLQTECNYMNKSCIVLRENTERWVATELGSCYLVGLSYDKIIETYNIIKEGKAKDNFLSYMDDGKASERIAEHLNKELNHVD